jgi:hypothetical protein
VVIEGDYDQSTLHACMEVSWWNPLVCTKLIYVNLKSCGNRVVTTGNSGHAKDMVRLGLAEHGDFY